MLDEKNVLGVESWTLNTADLQEQLDETKWKLHLSRTMELRQQVSELDKQMSEDRQRVKELRALAYQTAVKNKPFIEELKLETARLMNESIGIDNESVMLELSLRPRQQELAELRKQIEADKNLL